jgi:tetratricopeptide (TPR) repeat protein
VIGLILRRLAWLTVVLTALTPIATLGAQLQAPKRPELPDGADPNDAYSYYRLATSAIRKDPDKAASAYYWAARLNPLWAEPYYGRRTALMLRDPRKLARYWRGEKGLINSKEALAIDSLYAYARDLDPFLGPQLDHFLLETLVIEISNHASQGSDVSPNEIAYLLKTYLSSGPPEMRAAMAYNDGAYPEALRLYALAISHSRYKGPLFAERGRLFFQMGNADSALGTMSHAVEEIRKQDKNDLVFVYESKALMEERIGMIQHALGHKDAAKEAFGRALQEDLSYFPAHVQLGYLALESGDTATAISELDLAVEIRPDDAGLRYQYGYALATLGKHREAEAQLEKAATIDPEFATPHFLLGLVAESLGNKPAALQHYQTFLSVAPANDTRRQEASQTVEILKAATGTAK